MAKGKGFDVVADAQELSQHNINPHYWVNKVTSYTYARWMAEKKLAFIVLPMYVIFWVLFIMSFKDRFASDGSRLWDSLFNFSDSSILSFWVSILFLFFYTLVSIVMVIQVIFAPRLKTTSSIQKPEKKKKLPRHRKDYH